MEKQLISTQQTQIILPTNMTRRKKIVLKSHYDQTVIKILAEKLKENVFPRKGFHKPKPIDIELISLEKYYEQYLIIKGKYSIDHCKSLSYSLEVEKDAHEVFLLNETLKPETNLDQSNDYSTIKINGVAHFHHEHEAGCIMDKNGRDIESKELDDILKEENKKEKLNKTGLRKKIPKSKISPEEEINLLRAKLVIRPKNTGEVIKEKFDIYERKIVYIPLFELNFRNKKTEKEAVVKINGINGKIVLTNFINKTIPIKILEELEIPSDQVTKIDTSASTEKLSESEIEKVITQNVINVEKKLSEKPVKEKTENKKSKKVLTNQPSVYKKSEERSEKDNLEFSAEATGDIFYVGDNVTAIVGDLEIPSGITVHDTLVVKGNLKIGNKCKMLATIKALGNIIIGANTIVKGNVISNQNVSVGPGVQIYGEVIIKKALRSRFPKVKGNTNE